MAWFLDLLLGLTVWWPVLVMVWAAEFLVRCWGGCRRFRQLREGSDDPPPPVSMGASAWADATPRPASRLIRTVVIANVRRRRETTCMTRKPLTDDIRHCLLVRDGRTSETVPLCLVTSCPSENRSAFQRQPLHPIARTTAEGRHISDAPVFTPYHRAEKQHTKQSVIADPHGMASHH